MIDEFDLDLHLGRLGDALTIAANHDLRRATRSPGFERRTLVLAAAVLTLLLGAGAGIAAGLLKTPSQEQQGLLNADVTFAGSHPACTQASVAEFRCVIDSTPSGLSIAGSYRGAKVASVDAEAKIDGGCVATSDDGRVWTCYLGDLAVQNGVIDAGLLGQTRSSPAHG